MKHRLSPRGRGRPSPRPGRVRGQKRSRPCPSASPLTLPSRRPGERRKHCLLIRLKCYPILSLFVSFCYSRGWLAFSGLARVCGAGKVRSRCARNTSCLVPVQPKRGPAPAAAKSSRKRRESGQIWAANWGERLTGQIGCEGPR